MSTGTAATTSTMTDAELHAAITELDVTNAWLASHLGITERTLYAWHAGGTIPGWASDKIKDLLADADSEAEKIYSQIMLTTPTAIATPRTDYYQSPEQKASGYPATWWCRVAARAVARAAQDGVQVRLQYGDVSSAGEA